MAIVWEELGASELVVENEEITNTGANSAEKQCTYRALKKGKMSVNLSAYSAGVNSAVTRSYVRKNEELATTSAYSPYMHCYEIDYEEGDIISIDFYRAGNSTGTVYLVTSMSYIKGTLEKTYDSSD